MDAICDFYSELRSASQDNSLPVTVRCLETIIRLSTAAAKARLAEGGLSPQLLAMCLLRCKASACVLPQKFDRPNRKCSFLLSQIGM